MVQPPPPRIGRSPLIGRLSTVDIVGIGQCIVRGGMKVRISFRKRTPSWKTVRRSSHAARPGGSIANSPSGSG